MQVRQSACCSAQTAVSGCALSDLVLGQTTHAVAVCRRLRSLESSVCRCPYLPGAILLAVRRSEGVGAGRIFPRPLPLPRRAAARTQHTRTFGPARSHHIVRIEHVPTPFIPIRRRSGGPPSSPPQASAGQTEEMDGPPLRRRPPTFPAYKTPHRARICSTGVGAGRT